MLSIGAAPMMSILVPTAAARQGRRAHKLFIDMDVRELSLT